MEVETCPHRLLGVSEFPHVLRGFPEPCKAAVLFPIRGKPQQPTSRSSTFLPSLGLNGNNLNFFFSYNLSPL